MGLFSLIGAGIGAIVGGPVGAKIGKTLGGALEGGSKKSSSVGTDFQATKAANISGLLVPITGGGGSSAVSRRAEDKVQKAEAVGLLLPVSEKAEEIKLEEDGSPIALQQEWNDFLRTD